MTLSIQTLTTSIAVTALVLASASTCLFNAGDAYALSLGTNITINDDPTKGLGQWTGLAASVGREDNEAEQGMVQSQSWDLEAFQLKGKVLSVVGGYDFYTGWAGTKAGDIFIDTDGNAVYSKKITTLNYDTYKAPGYTPISNSNFHYDYVVAVDWVHGTYNIVKLNENSQLLDTEFGNANNTNSNPWRYSSGGTVLSSGTIANDYRGTANTSIYSGKVFSNTDTNFDGWSGTEGADKHYVASFDLSSIAFGGGPSGTIFHTTMECGNDNLIGQAAQAPEPGTMMLLGMGMLGLAVYGKRRMNKDA